jgi:hypothetical protein
MLLLECRNFVHRIGIVLTSSDSLSVDTGRVWLGDGSGQVLLNTRRIARIQSIENFSSSHPQATPYDWKVHQEAWDEGIQWTLHNLDSGTLQNSEHRALLASEPIYLKRRQAAPQSSKHDL